MIYHDSTFATLATAPVKQTDTIVVRQTQDIYGYFDDITVKWTSSDKLMSVAIDAVGEFLGTTTKKATVKLLGIVDTAIVDDIFQIREGLYNADPSVSGYNYISEGFYIIDSIAYDYEAGSTTVTMYDHMWTASRTPYSTGIVTYPLTVNDLASGIASALGLDLMAGFDSLPNASYMILEDLYANISNATLQTVVQEIAASTGTVARISDTTLEFVQYNPLSETLDSLTLKKLKIGNLYGPVNSIVLGRVPQNDNIALTKVVAAGKNLWNFDAFTTQYYDPDGGFTSETNINELILTKTGDTRYYSAVVYNLSDLNLIEGGTYTVAIGDIINDTYGDGLFTLEYWRNSDDDRQWTDMDSNEDATFVYDTVNYHDYNIHFYINHGDETHDMSVTFNDVYLAEEASFSGYEAFTQAAPIEVQINNVEILDDDRQDLIVPLYDELIGIYWNASTADTVGLGWHEVGDVIYYQQGTTIVRSLLSEVHITLAGSIQESLVSVVPDVTTINYQTAGGILKTIYDTEIKVDKQGQDITSIVSQADVYQNETLNSFTEVYQTIDNVTTQIQSVGGGNLILNSVGYAKETDGTLSFWTKSGSGAVTSYSSAGSLSSGALSGNAIQLVGVSGTQITQRITVANTSAYSLGFRVNKTLGNGSATVTLSNAVTSFSISIDSSTGYIWQELKLENITPGQNYWDITLAVTGTTTSIEITDLRVMNGPTLVAWDQSHSEILNTQVALTTEGIRVSSSTHNGDYTVMTPLEFAGYSNVSGTSQKVFWVNRDTTEVANIQIDGNANFGNVIRAIPITSGAIAGLAFVGAIS